MGTRESPFKWLFGWCKTCCQLCCSCCRPGSLCPRCGSECCQCNCCPPWCPRLAADQIAPDEVTAEDYMDLDVEKAQARIKNKNRIKAAILSFMFFMLGIALTTLYAYSVLIVKSYNLWFCLVSTISLGTFICLGMAFSERFRITVLLMLPQLFSGQMKAVLLVIIMGLAMQGPAANTLENYQRGTQSVSCGIEVIKNQTVTLYEKIKKPLESAISVIKKLTSKLKSFASGAKDFFGSLLRGMKHIGAALKRVWVFISKIGEVCNEEMLNPYKKCTKAFEDGKENCLNLGFGPICNIVDGFKWLCGIAKIATVICVIPDNVGKFIDKHVKNPTSTLIGTIKEKFDFNISVKHDLGGTINSSKAVLTILKDIMNEVNEDLDPYREFFQMFSYSVFFVTLFTFIKALHYRHKYIFDDNFDNIYITRKFVEIDVMRVKQDRNALLPLSTHEAYDFIRPSAFRLTKREKAGYKFEIMAVFRSMVGITILILFDYIVYAVLSIVASHLEKDVILKPPEIAEVKVTGTGFISQMLSTLVSAFDVVQKENITATSRRCIPHPSEPDYVNHIVIGVMYVMVYTGSVAGVYIHRLKRYICAYYYPFREQERICFLYNNLLTKRVSLKEALMNSVIINMQDVEEDMGHTNMLLVLAAKCPGFSWLARFIGVSQQCCMACAKISTPSTSQYFRSCITSGCKGLYCAECCDFLENVCIICMAPLAYAEDFDEEIDSSDDEKIQLWIEAMKNMKKEEKARRKKMKGKLKQQLREIVKRRGLETPIVQQYKKARKLAESDTETSEFSEAKSDAESNLTDYSYQDRSEESD